MNISPDVIHRILFPLLSLPCIAAIAWTVRVKLNDGSRKEALFLALLGIDVLLYGYLTSLRFLGTTLPVAVYFLQSVLLDAIVPGAYVYFSRQMGRKWTNHTTLLLCALPALLLLPNSTIFVPGSIASVTSADIHPFTLNVIYGIDGHYTISMADVVVILQTLLTLNRMYSLVTVIRRYGLMLNPRMKAFGIWWLMAAVFIVMTSVVEIDDFFDTFNCLVFFVCYSTLFTAIFVLLALRFDLSPVILDNKTSDDDNTAVDEQQPQEAVNVDSFVQRSHEMAIRLNAVVEREQLYLNPDFNVDEALVMLGTNRTYFFKMMTAEFGMKFTDYVNEKRIAYAKQQLETTDKSIVEIAMECGFNDSSYFGRKFKDATGVTPASWRKGVK